MDIDYPGSIIGVEHGWKMKLASFMVLLNGSTSKYAGLVIIKISITCGDKLFKISHELRSQIEFSIGLLN